MGHSGSRLITRSSPKDALDNLTTTLDDVTRWEDKAQQLKDCIDGVRQPIGPNAAFGDRELTCASSVLECVEDLAGQKSGRSRSSLSAPSGVSATGVNFTSDSGHRSQLQKLEDSVDHERQLSRIVSSVDFPASHLFTSYATNSLKRHLEGDEASSSAKLGSAELPTGSSIGTSPEEHSRHEEVVSKYWYIHRMLQMMLNSAEHCYKLKDRLEHLEHVLKPKRLNSLPPMEQLKLRQTNDRTHRLIQQSMLNWDKARLAVRWMIRDYHLVVGSHVVQRSMGELNSVRGELQRAIMNNPGVVQKVQALDDLLYRLNVSALNLDLQRFLNEHDSLNAALNYHDKDLKGYLTTKDCTNMSASLFSQLDSNKDQKITYDDMRSSLMKSVDEVQRRAVRIGQLRAEGEDLQRRAAAGPVHNFAVLSSTNDSEIERISEDMMEHQSFLNSAWSFFHNSFGVHVFGVRPGEIQPQRLSMDFLRSAIAQVAASATSDPLMEQEMRGLSRCGIDLKADHQAEPYPHTASLGPMTSIRETPSEGMQTYSGQHDKMSTAQLASLAAAESNAPVTRGEGPMKESYEVRRSPREGGWRSEISSLDTKDERGPILPGEHKYASALPPVALSEFQRVPPSEIEPKEWQSSQQSKEFSRQARSSPAATRDYASSPAAEKDYDALPIGSNLSAKEREYGSDPTTYDLGYEKYGSTGSDNISYNKSDTTTLSRALGADPSPLMSADLNKEGAFNSQPGLSTATSTATHQSRVFIPIHQVEERVDEREEKHYQ